jgi:hypothetical protein
MLKERSGGGGELQIIISAENLLLLKSVSRWQTAEYEGTLQNVNEN